MPQRRQARHAYDEAALGKALREGLDPLSRPFNALMPHYELDLLLLQALNAYLHQLSSTKPPGREDGTSFLATVITLDADKRQSESVISILNAWAGTAPSAPNFSIPRDRARAHP